MEQQEPKPYYQRILTAFDGSREATAALHRSIDLAKMVGATVTAFSVDEHIPRYAKGVGKVEELDTLKRAYFAELRSQAQAVAAEAGWMVEVEAAVGRAAESILGYAREYGYDLIVMGHSQHSRVWGTIFGKTTAQVVDQARCDVIVVRSGPFEERRLYANRADAADSEWEKRAVAT